MKRVRSAEILISVAVRALPRGEVRQRYERELLSEIYSLPRRGQVAFAFGALGTAWALRRAVTGAALIGGTTIMTKRTPLLCRLNLKHDWVWHSIEGTSDRYLVCERCGKDGPGTTAQEANGAIITGIVSSNGGM